MTSTLLSCACGKVECRATGAPIAVVACHCDDCQRGSRQIEALPGAAPVVSEDGGTPYVLYRKDRVECTRGRELLQDLRLAHSSPTRRVVAGCCNSAMYLEFGKGHWLNMYRTRCRPPAPIVQMHIQTRFRPKPSRPLDDAPAYRAFPPSFFAKLLFARIAMLLSG